MNEELLAALAQLCETMSGQLQATQAIQDVVISTLLTSFPPLADTMQAHLEHRYDFAPADMSGTALKHFEERLDSLRSAIQTLGG